MRFTILALVFLATTLFVIGSAKVYAQSVSAKQSWVLDPSTLLFVWDGDTFYIRCQPQHPCTKKRLGVRVSNIDTAEINGKCPQEKRLAVMARDEAAQLIRNANEVVIHPGQRRVYDSNKRLLATISIDGYDLGDTLIASGLARPWTGRRKPWCR